MSAEVQEKGEVRIWQLLESVKDPEVPVLSVVDLGVVRKVEQDEEGWIVTITPTYSGCPAMQAIEDDIHSMLREYGFSPVKVNTVLTPAWTTDWISQEARQKLQDYGIAPPEEATSDKSFLTGQPKSVTCPHCKSEDTELISQFGSTACKALHRCKTCLEPFDYFKCI